VGRVAPAALDVRKTQRLGAQNTPGVGEQLNVTLPAVGLYLVPVATADTHVGAITLLDPNGESEDDRLMEAYASRAATAYLHALSHV
jgi:hypothetical protein